ncbi:MAG: TIGR03435 family protein [Acidobacteriota bacterium]|nr:TIGR03435 family protein [Acidobacteriota bacterium]
MPNRVLLIALALAAPLAHAQLPAAANAPCEQVAAGRTYDVVSIHPNHTDNGNFAATWGNDRYTATNVSLVQLIQQAYHLRENQITGIPGSIASVRYDIEAKVLGSGPAAPVKLSDRQLQCMLIPLLEERFRLRSHPESKILRVFDLVPVKTGSKLTPAEPDVTHGSINEKWQDTAWNLTATAATMADFASMLAEERQQTVIDKTGLPGRYNFTLKWARESSSDPDPNASPGIFTALEEQLGLKLQPAKGPVLTLVVDHAEPPTEN